MNQEKINEILELWESSNYSGNKDEFENADLSYAYLKNAYLKNADLENADLSYADLENAYLKNAYLSYADLKNANLKNANLKNANLKNANLSYANLKNADLENANLSYAYLKNAYLKNADLSYAYLKNAYLRNANLENAKFSDKLIIKNNKRSYYAESDYYCWIFEGIIKIGCEVHSYQEWKSFSNERILEMDGKRALKFWKKEKEIILKIHDNGELYDKNESRKNK